MFPSFWSSSWIFTSSYNFVHICIVLLYIFSILLISPSIFFVYSKSYFSLCALISVGVLGITFSYRYLISYLYLSIAYNIFWIFSSLLNSSGSALSSIVWKTSSSFCSRFSTHCVSSSFSCCTWLRVSPISLLLP